MLNSCEEELVVFEVMLSELRERNEMHDGVTLSHDSNASTQGRTSQLMTPKHPLSPIADANACRSRPVVSITDHRDTALGIRHAIDASSTRSATIDCLLRNSSPDPHQELAEPVSPATAPV